jgi:succinate dehydrogenase / fumarate reductase cytochrome b subunit
VPSRGPWGLYVLVVADAGGAPALNEGARVRRGRWVREVWDSTIGKKVIVAITGIILVAYVILHAYGNLKQFQGQGSSGSAIDRYAEWLRTVGEPAIPRNGVLWTIRVILILALVLHIVAIVQLTKRNVAATPKGHRPPRIQRSLASRTMLYTGFLLLAFIVFHVLQFTTRTIQVTPVYQGTVYMNLYVAFQKWYFVLLYVAAMGLLFLHLRHGVWSVTQTMGWDKPNRNTTLRRLATTIAVVVAVGFASVPLAIWTGIAPDPAPPAGQVASTEGAK